MAAPPSILAQLRSVVSAFQPADPVLMTNYAKPDFYPGMPEWLPQSLLDASNRLQKGFSSLPIVSHYQKRSAGRFVSKAAQLLEQHGVHLQPEIDLQTPLSQVVNTEILGPEQRESAMQKLIRMALTKDEIRDGNTEVNSWLDSASNMLCVDLSYVSHATIETIHTLLATQLMGGDNRIVIEVDVSDPETRFENLYQGLVETSGQADSSVADNMTSIIPVLKRMLVENPDKQVILLLKGFEPTQQSFEPFSSGIRALSNDTSMQFPDDSNGLKVIMTSAYPPALWGSAQGGFNVGNRIRYGDWPS